MYYIKHDTWNIYSYFQYNLNEVIKVNHMKCTSLIGQINFVHYNTFYYKTEVKVILSQIKVILILKYFDVFYSYK